MSVSRPLGRRRLPPSAVALTVVAACGGSSVVGPSCGDSRPITIEVQGRVTAADDGRPLAGATVESISGDPSASATTDGQGRYSLSIRDRCVYDADLVCRPPDAIPFLVAHLDRFDRDFEPRVEQPREETSAVPEGVDVVNATADFALRPTRPITLEVEGRLTRASDGEPIEAARVTVEWFAGPSLPFDVPGDSASTDEEGRYLLAWRHFCAIGGSSCFASFMVTAQKDDFWDAKVFQDLNVVGDSISLTVNFDGL